ncbi:MAG: GNAT family N-acetyltransferase [Clostridia bacterium]|nr:GNAT family N-acetyltransferase [Clostridia bacterium]
MESRNLIIRETTFDDCKYFANWEVNPDVTEFFTMDDDRNYEEIVTEFIKDSQDETKLCFTITLKPDMEPIGRVVISGINSHYDSLDITRIYIADPDNRNKGYGEEALRMVLEYAFIQLHMERVTLDHFTGNKPAANLYEKIGFKYEGVMRNAGKKNGKYVDLHLMSMLRSEYWSAK